MFDVIIVGSGVAAFSAAITAARKKLHVQLIMNSQGMYAARRFELNGYPGYLGKDAEQLFMNLRKQAEELGVSISDAGDGIEKISFRQENNHEIFILEDGRGNAHESRAVIVAAGKRPKKLGVPGEDAYAGRGVSYEIEEDVASLAGRRIVVIGAGNTGVDAALQFAQNAANVLILEVGDAVNCDDTLKERLAQAKRITSVFNATADRILGDEQVNGVSYVDKATGELKEVSADYVFVTAGMVPYTDFLRGFCDLNQKGEIIISARTNATSHVGVFAAGDITDTPEKDLIIDAGEGAKAALQCVKWLGTQ